VSLRLMPRETLKKKLSKNKIAMIQQLNFKV
jgi:hypothetical protein